MTSAGRKISTHTVENYLAALTDSFILYRCSRFDIKGQTILKNGRTNITSWISACAGIL